MEAVRVARLMSPYSQVRQKIKRWSPSPSGCHKHFWAPEILLFTVLASLCRCRGTSLSRFLDLSPYQIYDASLDFSGSMPMTFLVITSLGPRPPGIEPTTPSFPPLLHGVLLIVPRETPEREQNILFAGECQVNNIVCIEFCIPFNFNLLLYHQTCCFTHWVKYFSPKKDV